MSIKFKRIPQNPDYAINPDGMVLCIKTGNLIKIGLRSEDDPYERVVLRNPIKNKGVRQKWFSLHRLLAEAFIPNPLNKKTINHKNGIKFDNRLKNLEWATQSENVAHAFRTGLTRLPKGSKNPAAKLKETDIEVILKLSSKGFTTKYLSDKFKVDICTINRIKNGSRWGHI